MYIGIDLGTTGCKVVMFSSEGKELCQFNREYELIIDGSFIEQDANRWWELVSEGIAHVVAESGINEVSGISVSTQSISFVPVDESGQTLYNSITWLDMRADAECRELECRFGREVIFEKTGKHCEPDYTLPKLMWFRKNRPEIYRKACKLLLPLDFLNLKLCGRAITDYTCAGGTMLYNIHDKRWDPELLEFSDIDEALLPEVGEVGEAIGELLPSVAEGLGINGSCTVFLGGQDQKLAAIGAGITDGDCTVSFGTATAISKLNAPAESGGAASLFRLDSSKYITETALMTTGAALRWLAQTVFGGASYREMDILAEQSEPGARGVVFKTDLAGGGSISNLTLSTGRPDIVYALYEGVARDISDAVRGLGGAERLLVFGGGSRSRIWCEILARIAETDVYILETTETAALGAAMLASGGRLAPAVIKSIIKTERELRN